MPGMQTRNGKAFEYAMLDALYGVCVENQEVVREGSPSLNVARECFENQSQPEKDRMRLAADCAARLFIRMEPQLVNPLNNRPLVLKIQEDRWIVNSKSDRFYKVRDLLNSAGDKYPSVPCKRMLLNQ